ncbi:MAG: glutamine-hydrolyzing GMP synthase [Candidatus Diapherotrites archaeon CG11_big_fil_rev_8_21_14_0_20_37_9]|nr:MAG: glutamine-hydrolyzing GMP synthase [Candidatus Diapherotrites archaeon CG11_big_fil_rev_8_21_14_0_20_37_9]
MDTENKIIVLDFGSQYTHLLARRVRDLNVYSEIMAPTALADELKKAKGIILSGGPQSVYAKDAVAFNPEIFSLEIPVLGLCYGQQLIAHELGGKVEPGETKEYGTAKLVAEESELFNRVPKEFTAWMSHGDKVKELPIGFTQIGSTNDCEYAAIMDDEKRIFGLQFHPEVTHTENGLQIISNFVFDVCNCEKNWTMQNFLGEKIESIKKEAGDKNVFLLLSGGVDSTVCLALLDKAIGSERIHALHVDTGFMRKGESAFVKTELEKLGINEVHVADAEEEFLKKLKGIYDPEEKRQIIGKLFVEIAMQEIENMNFDTETWLLGQGTIYPDTIETGGTENAKKIKTHHNRAPIIMEMIEKGNVIEPLNQLYKDEVRELGKLLGLPENLVERHPFPGPGTAIRILCSNGKEKIDEALEKKIIKVAKEDGFEAKLLPVKAVGVQGDNRTYSNAVVLEGTLDYSALENASTKITNKFTSVNRVVFLLRPRGIDSLELKEAYLTKDRIEILKEADAIAMETIKERGLLHEIWQFPVVLLPVDFNGKGQGIVLRPVYSKEAMTAKFAKLGPSVLEEMVEKIKAIKGVGAVMLDITHKPPATIEWE